MPDETLIETKAIKVLDNFGKVYQFKVKVCNDYSHLLETVSLTFYVSYGIEPIVALTVYLVKDKNEFQNDCTAGWTYEIPERLRNRGIGLRLWKALEPIFQEYRVSSLWGNIETINMTDTDIKRKINFWKRAGFEIVNDYEIHKTYNLLST